MGVTKLTLQLLRTKAKIRVFTTGYTVTMVTYCGRRGDLMVSALVSRSSSLGSSPARGHCIVLFLGKTLLNSHCAPLHPGV